MTEMGEKRDWRFYTAGFEDGNKVHKSRNIGNIGSFWKLGKAKKQILPYSFWRKVGTANTFLFSQWNPLWTSDLQNCKKIDECYWNLLHFLVISCSSNRKLIQAFTVHIHMSVQVTNCYILDTFKCIFQFLLPKLHRHINIQTTMWWSHLWSYSSCSKKQVSAFLIRLSLNVHLDSNLSE